MSYSLIKCWPHAVWTTKNCGFLIQPSIEQVVFKEIESQFRSEKCHVKIINGMPDHVHSLFMSNPRRSISDILKTVKGCSSHIFNGDEIFPGKFAWQKGSAAFSVSESQLEKVYRYISNQNIHNLSKTLQQEIDELYIVHGNLFTFNS